MGASGGGGRVCEQLVDGRENIRESGDRSRWAERLAFLSLLPTCEREQEVCGVVRWVARHQLLTQAAVSFCATLSSPSPRRAAI